MVVASGAYSCSGFLPWWLLLLQNTGSRCADSEVAALRRSCLRHVESSQTRDQTHVLCSGRQIPIHCTTKKVHDLQVFNQHLLWGHFLSQDVVDLVVNNTVVDLVGGQWWTPRRQSRENVCSRDGTCVYLCLGEKGKASLPSQGLPFNDCETKLPGPSLPQFSAQSENKNGLYHRILVMVKWEKWMQQIWLSACRQYLINAH